MLEENIKNGYIKTIDEENLRNTIKKYIKYAYDNLRILNNKKKKSKTSKTRNITTDLKSKSASELPNRIKNLRINKTLNKQKLMKEKKEFLLVKKNYKNSKFLENYEKSINIME